MIGQLLPIGISVLSLCSLSACYTVPETGRSSLNLMPENTVATLALNSFNAMKEEKILSSDVEKNERVKRVGRRIAAAAAESADLPPPDEWEFVVFEEDETVNAFAMPGGKIAVYTGLLNLVKSDDELAVVLGHEVAHVSARHGNERMSQNVLIKGLGFALAIGVMRSGGGNQSAILDAYGAGSTLGIVLPFSRRDETEADCMGLIYMARAGYDPRSAVTFWESMKQEEESILPEFFSTHPADDSRIETIKSQLPQVIPIYEEALVKMNTATAEIIEPKILIEG